MKETKVGFRKINGQVFINAKDFLLFLMSDKSIHPEVNKVLDSIINQLKEMVYKA